MRYFEFILCPYTFLVDKYFFNRWNEVLIDKYSLVYIFQALMVDFFFNYKPVMINYKYNMNVHRKRYNFNLVTQLKLHVRILWHTFLQLYMHPTMRGLFLLGTHNQRTSNNHCRLIYCFMEYCTTPHWNNPTQLSLDTLEALDFETLSWSGTPQWGPPIEDQSRLKWMPFQCFNITKIYSNKSVVG